MPNSASGKCHNASDIRVTLNVEPAGLKSGPLLPPGEALEKGMSQKLHGDCRRCLIETLGSAIMDPSPFLLESFRGVINSL